MNWLKKHSIEIPDNKFINDLTFKQVYEKVNDIAKKLYPYVKNEKRVAIYSKNSVDVALFFLSLHYLKKEVLMLNTRLVHEEIYEQLRSLNIKTVFSDNEEFISYKDIYISDKSDVELIEEIDENQVIAIMNTSATTGSFKTVPIKWKQLASHVKASQKSLGVTKSDNWLCTLPMYHIGGLTILLRSLYNGTRITILNKFNESDIIKLIQSYKINMISVVPTMLSRIINKIEKHKLRVVLVGGEFIPKSLVENCISKNIPIYKTYGMTETCSQSTTFSVLDYPNKIESVGLPLDGVDIYIQNPDEKGIGHIYVKSPMLMDGYIGEQKITGYFDTEDIGYLDEEGFLYILDRRKNLIISGGENIYPKEIEDLLYALPETKECAIVGIKNNKWGKVPILYIVSTLDKETILNYLSKKLAKYKIPKEIIFLEELPKNALGKILKNNLE